MDLDSHDLQRFHRFAAYHKVLNLFIHSFIPAISIAPLQVLHHSEALEIPITAQNLELRDQDFT